MSTLLHTTGSTKAAIKRTVTNTGEDLGAGAGVYFPLGDHVGEGTLSLTHSCWLRAGAFADAGPGWYALYIVRYDGTNDIYEYWNEGTLAWDVGTQSTGHAIKLVITAVDTWQQFTTAFTTTAPDSLYELWSRLEDWGAGNATLTAQDLYLDDIDLKLTGSPFTSFCPNGGLDKAIMDDYGNLISNLSNESPIKATISVDMGEQNGDVVEISGATGNTAANGDWIITRVDTTHFTLDDSTGNGTYGSGAAVIWDYGNCSSATDISGINTAVGYYRYWRFVWEIAAPPATIPDDPSDLTAVISDGTDIVLEWVDNSDDESGFKIERSADGTSGWALVHTTAADVETWTDEDLADDTRYYYRLCATNSAGDSDYTNIAYADTDEGTYPWFRDLNHTHRKFILPGDKGFSLTRPDLSRVVNEVEVNFTSEWQKESKSDPVVVRDVTHQATHTINAKTLDCPSIARADGAVRIAKWKASQLRSESPQVKFQTGLQGLRLAPGDLIKVSHKSCDWDGVTVRVRRVTIPEKIIPVTVEADPYDATWYTDVGEPSEPWSVATLPTIALTVDDSHARRIELSWELSASNQRVRFYEVYVAIAEDVDADDPEDDFLVKTNLHRQSYVYQVPDADRGKEHRIRVLAVMSDGQHAVSDQESAYESPDDPSSTVVDNKISYSDFQDGTKWDFWNGAATPGTGHVYVDTVHKQDSGPALLFYAYNMLMVYSSYYTPQTELDEWAGMTISRTIPHRNTVTDRRFGPKGAWYTVGFSIYPEVISGYDVDPSIKIAFWSGDGTGDPGAQDNYQEMLELDDVTMQTLAGQEWSLIVGQFQMPAGVPTKAGTGNYNYIGIRFYGMMCVLIDKIFLARGKIHHAGVIWAPDKKDVNADDYDGHYAFGASETALLIDPTDPARGGTGGNVIQLPAVQIVGD